MLWNYEGVFKRHTYSIFTFIEYSCILTEFLDSIHMNNNEIEEMFEEKIRKLRIRVSAEGDYGGGRLLVELLYDDEVIAKDEVSTLRLSAVRDWDDYEG